MVDRLTPSNRAMLETLLLGRVSRSRDWRICAGHRRGPAQALAPGAGGVQALAGALDDQLADELGQGREHVEDQPAARSVVSSASCRDRNPTLRRRSPATMVIRSCRDRDSRSRLGTTGVSPACR
jgi:hypothetical protein